MSPSSTPMRSLAAVLALALGCAGAAHAEDAAPPPALKLTKCQISSSTGLTRRDAECGSWTVPEDRANPKGKQITLEVAVVRARTKASEKAPDPLFFIAGGPGQGSIEGYLAMEEAFTRVLRKRDVVLVDQRGTGGSNPMACKFDYEVEGLDRSVDKQVAWFKACLAKLPGDPRFYTTSVAIDDLDAVRRALGYRQIDLYGISYGTRVALAYLRKYGDATRSVVVDGVVPMDLTLGPNISLESQRAAEQLFDRCAKDHACHEAFPDLAGDFDRLLARLKGGPVKLDVRDPISGDLIHTQLTYESAAGVVRMLLYSTESASILPLLIHSAAAGDYAPLAATAMLVTRTIGGSINIGMHNAVVCTEDAPFYTDDPKVEQAMRETYLGTFSFDVLKQACAAWPRGVMDPGFKEPVRSDKPVLLLSGEIDPITPPSNAAHAAETLTHSRSLIAKRQGHGVATRGCAPKLVARFLDTADPASVDGKCLDTLHGSPFFVRFTGAAP